MSLLADLLSKVKPTEQKGDIPPGLKQVVIDSSRKRVVRKRFLLASLIALVLVAGGFGAIYLADLYLTPALPQRPAQKPGPVQPQAEAKPVTPPTAAQPQPVSELKPDARVEVKPRPPKAERDYPSQALTDKAKKPAPLVTAKRQVEPRTQRMRKEPEPAGALSASLPVGKEERLTPELKNERDVYIYTAQTYEGRKEYREALANYRKALTIDPNNHVLLNNMASVLLKLDFFSEAAGYAAKALAARRDYVPALTNLGIGSIELGNLKGGEETLLKAKSLDPLNRYVLFNLALLYEKQKEYDKAFGLYHSLSLMVDMQGYLGMARISEKQGKIGEARSIYTTLLGMNNSGPAVKQQAQERLSVIGTK